MQAVTEGLIIKAQIDTSLKRLFLARMKLTLFDAPAKVKWASTPSIVLNSTAHQSERATTTDSRPTPSRLGAAFAKQCRRQPRCCTHAVPISLHGHVSAKSNGDILSWLDRNDEVSFAAR